MIPILVGEQNQISVERRFDLYPMPEHSTGGRLCSKILGMKKTTYIRSFIRKNLLGPGAWNAKEAARSASLIMLGIEVEKRREPARIVLLGAKVCAAFGVPQIADFGIWDGPKASFLRLPHPSGRCRKWNEPGSYEEARDALRRFLPPEVAAKIGDADGRA